MSPRMIVLILLLAVTGLRAEELTTQEKLGYGKDAILVIVNADDSGMCHSANMATFQAMTEGYVTSTTAMVPCPWFPEWAKIAREHPALDVGLHLCLTSEWSYYRWRGVSPSSEIRGLLDDEGFLWRDISSYKAHARPEEIERELRAQVERALFFGVKPTHIDCHMGCYEYHPAAWKIAVQIAREYNLPMRSGWMGRSVALRKEGFAVPDTFYMPTAPSNYEERFQVYADWVRRLKPGVHECGIHLALDDDEIKHITNAWKWRVGDFKAFTDPRMKQIMDEKGVVLIGWRALYDLQQKQRQGTRELKPTNLPPMSKERVEGYWESVWDLGIRLFQETEGQVEVPNPEQKDHAARTMGYPDGERFEIAAQTWNGDAWQEIRDKWQKRINEDLDRERKRRESPQPADDSPKTPPANDGEY